MLLVFYALFVLFLFHIRTFYLVSDEERVTYSILFKRLLGDK